MGWEVGEQAAERKTGRDNGLTQGLEDCDADAVVCLDCAIDELANLARNLEKGRGNVTSSAWGGQGEAKSRRGGTLHFD